jgi:hypothetical protein
VGLNFTRQDHHLPTTKHFAQRPEKWSETIFLDATLRYSRVFDAKASLHFCQECNNLLYPKADAQRRIIVYACRICQYSEIVENQLVYRNDLLTVTKYASVSLQNDSFSDGSRREQVGVTTDLGADATLVYDLVS